MPCNLFYKCHDTPPHTGASCRSVILIVVVITLPERSLFLKRGLFLCWFKYRFHLFHKGFCGNGAYVTQALVSSILGFVSGKLVSAATGPPLDSIPAVARSIRPPRWWPPDSSRPGFRSSLPGRISAWLYLPLHPGKLNRLGRVGMPARCPPGW